MISYKDRCYCIAKCPLDSCSRKLTAQVMLDAAKFGLPVSQSDFSTSCEAFQKYGRGDDLPL